MRTVVGVLRGGPSSEYEISLQSGAHVLEKLDPEKYDVRDIFISRGGDWHVHGVVMLPEKALRGVDVAFNVLHGDYGENGGVQRMLGSLGVPYTGADPFASALSFNKHQTREVVAKLGVKVPHGVVVEKAYDLEPLALSLFRSFPHPAIVKPVAGGSSVGVAVANTYHELLSGLEQAFEHGERVLVEEFIAGKEGTLGVIDGFRGEKLYALLPVEIIPPKKHGFFSYDAKYSGETTERVPGNFTKKEKDLMAKAARLAHEGLGLGHYSRSDFIVSKRGVYFLEVNSAAACGMTRESLFPKAIEAVGARVSDFLDHVVQLALKPQKR
ncbi:MAG: ATP-grasp domain-containing protein [bacterium]